MENAKGKRENKHTCPDGVQLVMNPINYGKSEDAFG